MCSSHTPTIAQHPVSSPPTANTLDWICHAQAIAARGKRNAKPNPQDLSFSLSTVYLTVRLVASTVLVSVRSDSEVLPQPSLLLTPADAAIVVFQRQISCMFHNLMPV